MSDTSTRYEPSAQRALKVTFVQPLGPRLQRQLGGVSPAGGPASAAPQPFLRCHSPTAAFRVSTGSSFVQKALRKYFSS